MKFFLNFVLNKQKNVYICSPLEIADFFITKKVKKPM